MKVDISIEATAQEMREFLGLPNVQPLQNEMMEIIRDNVHKGASGFDPLTLMKPLLPTQVQSMEVFQKAFWDAFTKTDSSPKDTTKATSGNKTEKK